MANKASDVLSAARSQLGATDGTKYGRWYAQATGRPEYAAIGTAWCAMFVSWCFAQAGASCVGLPGAYCPSIYAAARAKGKTRAASEARAGDVILFDWDGGNPDHVGVVESHAGGVLTTIEGNVSGAVRRKTRRYGDVKAIVRPDYTTQETEGDEVYPFAQVKQGSRNATVKLLQAALNVRNGAGLVVDGYFGAVTGDACAAWQKKRGLVVDRVCGPITWASLLGK